MQESKPKITEVISLVKIYTMCSVSLFACFILFYRKAVKIHMMFDGTRFLHRVPAEVSVIVICRSLISVMTALDLYQVQSLYDMFRILGVM